jgi:TonB family protein
MYEGTFDLVWNSPSQWREQLQLPGYLRVRVGGEHKYWLQRNVPFEPVRVDQLDQLLNFSSKSRVGSHEKLGKMQEKKENGVVRRCVDVNRNPGLGKRILCFDPVSGALVMEEDSQPRTPTVLQPFQITRSEYSDFHDWAAHTYPYTITGFAGKTSAVEFHVEEVSPVEATDPSLFERHESAEEWDSCDSPEEVAILEQQPPKYPEEARRSAISGVVQIYAVIETDGGVSHLAVLSSARADMDSAALAAVSKWRYRPPACNGRPFRTHTIITVTFLLG